MIPEYKQFLNVLDTTAYLFSQSFNIFTDYQREQFMLMELSILYSNQNFTEMFKISIKAKQVWK